jgi:Mrp family chromosome partitioning ATPase
MNATQRERDRLLDAVRGVTVLARLDQLRMHQPDAELPAIMAGRRMKGPRGSMSMGGATALAIESESRPAPQPATRPIAVGVTSPDSGDGKTTIAIALASSLAQDFATNVLLVDADFRTGSLGEGYGLAGKAGLTDMLDGQATLRAATHRFMRSPVSVVTAGTGAGAFPRMARSERLPDVLEAMKARNDFVVLDLPAALRTPSTAALAARCDGVIVVVRGGRTTRRDLEHTLERLRDTRVLGVVVNEYASAVPGWAERLLDLGR